MTVFWLVHRSVSPPLFSCRWPCSDWSEGRSRLRCSIEHNRVLIGPWSVSSPLFYCVWPCSDWSVGWSRFHCSLVDDRVLIGPKVSLASIVLLLMTVFWLVRRSVSPPLFSCRWPCSDWSAGRSRLRCCHVDNSVLFGPLVGLASIVLLSMTMLWLIRRLVSPPLFTCRWPCSHWSVGRSRLHCSLVDDRVLFGP